MTDTSGRKPTPTSFVDELSSTLRRLEERTRRLENGITEVRTTEEERRRALADRTAGCEHKFEALYDRSNEYSLRIQVLETIVAALQGHDQQQDEHQLRRDNVWTQFKLVLLAAIAGALATKAFSLVW